MTQQINTYKDVHHPIDSQIKFNSDQVKMAISPRRKSFLPSYFCILLVTIVYFYPQGNEAVEINTDENGSNFVDSKNNAFEESIDEEELFRFIANFINEEEISENNQLSNDELPENVLIREYENLNIPENNPVEITEDQLRLQRLNEEAIDLPERFLYVIREFNKSLNRPSGSSKANSEIAENDENGEEEISRDGEDRKEINGKNRHVDWKNIIGGPDRECPEGQRKDPNGRCRQIIW